MDGLSLRTILVGVDGSERAVVAADFAARVAAASGARLIVASVYSFRTLGGRLESGERAAARAKDAARRAARGAVECRIAPALSPADGLREIASTEAVDLVVLGTRHRGRLGEALGGGVARRLLRDAMFPVALVPSAGRPVGVQRIGVLPGGGADGARAVAVGRAWARDTAADVRVYGGGRRGKRLLSDDLAGGRLDVLVVPAWPHGLAGRLRGQTPRRTGACVLVIVPPGAPLAARADAAVAAE